MSNALIMTFIIIYKCFTEVWISASIIRMFAKVFFSINISNCNLLESASGNPAHSPLLSKHHHLHFTTAMPCLPSITLKTYSFRIYLWQHISFFYQTRRNSKVIQPISTRNLTLPSSLCLVPIGWEVLFYFILQFSSCFCISSLKGLSFINQFSVSNEISS